MKSIIIGVESDLGVHIDGARLGPKQLINDVKSFYKGEVLSYKQDENIIKSRNISDRNKNKYEINRLNEKIYNDVVEKIRLGYFPITLGGDHSVVIPSILANARVNEDIGLIVFNAYPDYNTFKTTTTGNIDGLSVAALTEKECFELRSFHRGENIQPAKTVIVGIHNVDEGEMEILKYSGVSYFTTDDIKKEGLKTICDKAFQIAGYKTKSIHVTFDLDLIDPSIAPGVSIPLFDGLTYEDGMDICDKIIENFSKVSGFDLVELNPLRDVNRKTEQIALNMLVKILEKIEELPDKQY